VKDGINDYIVHGKDTVNPGQQGTKVAAHYKLSIEAGQSSEIRLRLTKSARGARKTPFGKSFDKVFADRLREANQFYQSIVPASVSEDEASIMRQAIALNAAHFNTQAWCRSIS
jgi:hypothetical protein